MMTYEEEMTQLLDHGRFFGGFRIKSVTVPGMFFKDGNDFTSELLIDFGIDRNYTDYLYLVKSANDSYYVVGVDSKNNKSLKAWYKLLSPEWQHYKIKDHLKNLSYKVQVELSKFRNPSEHARLEPISEIDDFPKLKVSKDSYYTKPMAGMLSSVPTDWKYNQTFDLDGQQLFRLWDFSKWPFFHENEYLFTGRVELYVCGPWKFKKLVKEAN